MKEIFDTMSKITKMTIAIQVGNFPAQIKDKSKQILIYCVKMINEEFSPQKINQLVVAEYRKKTMK